MVGLFGFWFGDFWFSLIGMFGLSMFVFGILDFWMLGIFAFWGLSEFGPIYRRYNGDLA